MPEAEPAPRLRPLEAAVLVLACAALVYGASYQQFRHFDWSDHRGVADAADYRRMAHGDYTVDPIRAYRPVVPALAGALGDALAAATDSGPLRDADERDKLAFYTVNFGFTLAAAVLLFGILRELRFSPGSALLGVAIFASSRSAVLAAGTPLTDSYYLAGVAAIVLLALRPTPARLLLTLPLVVLSKESILPLALLPLLRPEARGLLYGASLAVALALVAAVRSAIGGQLAAAGADAASTGLLAVIGQHVALLGRTTLGTLTPGGLHDLLNGFSFFAPLAAWGWWIDRKRERPRVPSALVWLVPLALLYALLSGTRGRQLFAAFPVVIPYTLLALEHAWRRVKGAREG